MYIQFLHLDFLLDSRGTHNMATYQTVHRRRYLHYRVRILSSVSRSNYLLLHTYASINNKLIKKTIYIQSCILTLPINDDAFKLDKHDFTSLLVYHMGLK